MAAATGQGAGTTTSTTAITTVASAADHNDDTTGSGPISLRANHHPPSSTQVSDSTVTNAAPARPNFGVSSRFSTTFRTAALLTNRRSQPWRLQPISRLRNAPPSTVSATVAIR